MKHLFVSHDLALKLKEKGFDESCFCYYTSMDKIIPSYPEENFKYPRNSDLIKDWVSAPSHQQVIDWFRDKYNISIEITYDPICENICDELDDSVNNAIWFINLIILNPYNCITPNYQRTDNKQLTYESARKVAINEALKLI